MEASNYRQAFKAAIARIYHSNGTIVGAGFLVTDQQLLTCAHVVTAALGLPTTLQDAPTDAVELDFPLIAPGQKVKARVRYWRPVQFLPLSSPKAGEDMAGLVLESSPPVGCQPVRLVASNELWAHPFQIFGFPSQRDEGIWASGVMRDRLASGWVQIEDIKAQRHPVQPGFSGAPVWDEQVEGVVGMAVAADKKRDETRTAFMIPTSILSGAWTELGQAIQLPVDLVGLSEAEAKRALLDGLKSDSRPLQKPMFPEIGGSKEATSSKPVITEPKDFSSALSRVQQIKEKNLQQRLDTLTVDYEALAKQRDYTTNVADRNSLERQLEAIAEDMNKVATELDALGA